ncbi:hypothetical protein TrVE_jg3875 [Triparma verrucosa]|uniref:Uncharacterized protein n=1 Tax=Triparma verrucosa TaxID=1606542 RepID=A0A9W7BZL5_9STRA|nr:hypothetical protein TrVE_jg3875 [Triparma verrucosa]
MGSMCSKSDSAEGGKEPKRHISAAGSDLAAPLVTSEADVDVSLSPPSSSNGASEDVDLASSDLNGTWEQDRMVDVDKYLTHSNVPWLVKKMILKIKPKMIIELSATGFKFTMSGGPKSKVEEGQWNVTFPSTNPRGDEIMNTTTYRIDESKGLCLETKLKNEERGTEDVLTRYIRDGECVLQLGPKLSLKDGKSNIMGERIFARK